MNTPLGDTTCQGMYHVAMSPKQSNPEKKPRRRNHGVNFDGTDPKPLWDDEEQLVAYATAIVNVDAVYRQRNELIVKMYDYGYTAKQLVDLMNDRTGSTLTYDAIGRIIRAARNSGVDV